MSLENTLSERSHSQCELCSATTNLSVYTLPPAHETTADKCVMVCETCLNLINDSSNSNPSHWRCLAQSMWSEHMAVQVLTWRLLKRIELQDWATDLSSQMYLDDDNLKWAKASSLVEDVNTDPVTKDSNGTVLIDGDSVTLIKDLDVKGANFTAKRGTLVKNIVLTSNPAHIEGRVNGTHIVLLTCFLKKAV